MLKFRLNGVAGTEQTFSCSVVQPPGRVSRKGCPVGTRGQHCQQLGFERTGLVKGSGWGIDGLHSTHWLEFCLLRSANLVQLPKGITFQMLADRALARLSVALSSSPGSLCFNQCSYDTVESLTISLITCLCSQHSRLKSWLLLESVCDPVVGEKGGARKGCYVPFFIYKAGSVALLTLWGVGRGHAWCCGGFSTEPGTSPSLRTWGLLLQFSLRVIWNQSWWLLAFPLAQEPCPFCSYWFWSIALLWPWVSKTRLCTTARCWCHSVLVSVVPCFGWFIWAP